GSISRRMQRPVVDLPQPDSPTSPSVSPAARSKLTSLTACTHSKGEKMPPPITNSFTSLSTRSRGSVMAGPWSCQDAGGLVARRYLAQRRRCLEAHRARESASRREATAGGRVQQVRHCAPDDFETGFAGCGRVDAWDRTDQTLRVGMSRMTEQL